MRDKILALPSQIAAGAALGEAAKVQRPYRRVICAGMGGSSIAGEMLSLLDDNVVVHWDYGLPANTDPKDLVVCTSWSGSTEEVLDTYAAARAAGMETLCITNGGKLAEAARAGGTPLILLGADPASPPRTGVGLMTGALLAALAHAKALPAALDTAGAETEGAKLAEQAGSRMLALYAAHPWRKMTGWWKMAYSETAKRQVMANWLPSGAHTEVVGWEGPYQDAVAPVLFRTDDEDPRHAKALDALLAILTKNGYTCLTVRLHGASVLEKAFNGYLTGLCAAFAAAMNQGVDPEKTVLLDEFKRLKNS